MIRDFRWEPAQLQDIQPRDEEQKQRIAMFISTLEGDSQRALQNWRQQTKPATEPTELRVLLINMLDTNDSAFTDVLTAYAKTNPLEAQILRAAWFERQGELQRAAEQLIAVFTAARATPWIDSVSLDRALALAEKIADSGPALATGLYDAIKQPFAVHHPHGNRLASLFHIAQDVGQAAVIEVLESQEPYVAWVEPLLRVRAEAYRKAHHPVADTAEAELNAYRANER